MQFRVFVTGISSKCTDARYNYFSTTGEMCFGSEISSSAYLWHLLLYCSRHTGADTISLLSELKAQAACQNLYLLFLGDLWHMEVFCLLVKPSDNIPLWVVKGLFLLYHFHLEFF